jgi:hypothetical protein
MDKKIADNKNVIIKNNADLIIDWAKVTRNSRYKYKYFLKIHW